MQIWEWRELGLKAPDQCSVRIIHSQVVGLKFENAGATIRAGDRIEEVHLCRIETAIVFFGFLQD